MEFLEGAGLVRRIETLSAYVLCCDRAATASAPLFICERCHEVHDAPAGAGPAATPEGLRVVRSVAEHYGLCAACSGAAGAPLEAS
jgi:Fur family zinc uptake transcriptional regulator